MRAAHSGVALQPAPRHSVSVRELPTPQVGLEPLTYCYGVVVAALWGGRDRPPPPPLDSRATAPMVPVLQGEMCTPRGTASLRIPLNAQAGKPSGAGWWDRDLRILLRTPAGYFCNVLCTGA